MVVGHSHVRAGFWQASVFGHEADSGIEKFLGICICICVCRLQLINRAVGV